ncbi:MAG: hypothetical protein ACKVS8_08065 [Phycisphaerales bacterium]
MTFKGTYQHGVVILDSSDGLREGARVEVLPTAKAKPRSGVKAKARPARAKDPTRRTLSRAPFGFGLWRNRKDLGKTSGEIAKTLRARLMKRAVDD